MWTNNIQKVKQKPNENTQVKSILNSWRKVPHFMPMNIQGSDIEFVASYNKLDWTD